MAANQKIKSREECYFLSVDFRETVLDFQLNDLIGILIKCHCVSWPESAPKTNDTELTYHQTLSKQID